MQLLDDVPLCPFCGGQPQSFINTYHEWSVHCSVCGVSVTGKGSRKAAIDHWSTRFEPDSTQSNQREVSTVETTVDMAVYALCCAKLNHEMNQSTPAVNKFTSHDIQRMIDLHTPSSVAFARSHYESVDSMLHDFERRGIVLIEDEQVTLTSATDQFFSAIRIQNTVSQKASMDSIGSALANNISATLQLSEGEV